MSRERLQKLLAQAGISSRRAAEQLITAGRVRLNGRIVIELGIKADYRDRIEVDGKRIVGERPAYYLLHKPREIVTTLSDPEGRPTVAELLKRIPERVFPVGRLDFHTSGALLLTNDGDMTQALLHPRKHVPKTYIAKIKGELPLKALQALREGLVLDDGHKTAKSETFVVNAERGHTWLQLTITEGKNRQVHRMLEALGYQVQRLARTTFAGLDTEGMRPGQVRELSPSEVAKLKRDYLNPSRKEESNRKRDARRARAEAAQHQATVEQGEDADVAEEAKREEPTAVPPARKPPQPPQADRFPRRKPQPPPNRFQRSSKPDRFAAAPKSDETRGPRPDRFQRGSKPDRFAAPKPDDTRGPRPDRFQRSKTDRFGAAKSDETRGPRPDRFQRSKPDRFAAPKPDDTRGPRPNRFQRSKPDRFNAPKPDDKRGPLPNRFQRSKPDRFSAPKPDDKRGPKPDRFRGAKPDRVRGSKPDRFNAPKPDDTRGPLPNRFQRSKPDRFNAPKPHDTRSPKPDRFHAAKPDRFRAPEPNGPRRPKPHALRAPKPDPLNEPDRFVALKPKRRRGRPQPEGLRGPDQQPIRGADPKSLRLRANKARTKLRRK